MSIKLETRVSDLQKYLAQQATFMRRSTAMDVLRRIIYNGCSGIDAALADAKLSASDHREAEAAFDKIPLGRRSSAETAAKHVRSMGAQVSREGREYSGNTTYGAAWSTTGEACASTYTSSGGSHSRACKYRKTDADHRVMLDPAGAILLYDNPVLTEQSDREGLPLIALYPDNSAVWVRRKGKGIVSERGWVAWEGWHCSHSTKSLKHAQACLKRKRDAAAREDKLKLDNAKKARRDRLVARLCGGAIATVEDAKKLGFCAPGIAAFQHKRGIGDAASLPELMRSGNELAIKLALSLARGVKRKA